MKGFSEQANVAGYDWLQAFRNRHSHLSTRKPEDFSLSRAMNLIEVVVKQHFDEFFKVMSDNNITGHRVWNIVETGLQAVFEPCDVTGSSQSRALILLVGKREETTTLVLPEEPLHTWLYLRGSDRTCRSKRQYETLSACPSLDGSRTRRWQSGVITSFAICSKIRIGWKGPASFRWTHNSFTEPWVYRWNAKENCHFVVFPTSQSRYLQPLDNNVFSSLKKHWNRLAEEMSHNKLWCILFAHFRLRLLQP